MGTQAETLQPSARTGCAVPIRRPRSHQRASPGACYLPLVRQFRDRDGNGGLFQEVTTLLPGRELSSLDIAALTDLLREAEIHHGEYEPSAPKHHWSVWCAAYIVARQDGKTPEEAAKDGKLHIEGNR